MLFKEEKMKVTRRAFSKWGITTASCAAMNPSLLWAEEQAGFAALGLKEAGKLKTKSSAEIKSSPLSVGYETLDRELFDPQKTFKHAAQLGVKWARCQTGWVRCEKEKGVYDFGWLDEVVDGLLKIGIQPWFNLGYGNPLYTPEADKTGVGWAPIFDEEAMKGWLAYTKALAEHFKDRVKYWEIWNESNITAFWKPGKADPESYTKLVARTAPVLRKHVPNSVLIGGGFAGVPIKYFESCLEAGIADHVDKISYHPYRVTPESGYETHVQKLRGSLKKYNATHIKLWQGENGCPSQKGSSGALGGQDWDETSQAKWVCRRVLSDLRLEIEFISYFLIVDLVGYRGRTNYKGLLHGKTYAPKKAYYTLQNLCTLFDAQTKRFVMPFKMDGIEKCKRWAAGFKRNGKPMVAYWSIESPLKDMPMQEVKITLGEKELAQMPNPALLDPISGTIYKISSMDKLPLVNYPLILADASVFVSG